MGYKPQRRDGIRQQKIRMCPLAFLKSEDDVLYGICSITCYYRMFLIYTPKAPQPSASLRLGALSWLHKVVLSTEAASFPQLLCGCVWSSAQVRLLIHLQKEY